MNILGKLMVIAAVFAATVSLAHADTILLGSFATGAAASSFGFSSTQTAMNFAGVTTYSSIPATPTTPTILTGTANTYALTNGSAWASAIGTSSWIGEATTAGPGGSSSPAWGYYQFTTSFTANGGTYAGTIDLMADDTAEVLLNGVPIVPFGTLGTHCAGTGDGCLSGDVFTLSGISLLSGVDANRLTFIVEQAGNLQAGLDPSGLDFTANLSSGAAPEPGSLVLLGTGMMTGAGVLFRRKRRDA